MAFTYTTRKDGRLMKRVSINGKLQTIYANNPKDLENQYVKIKYFDNKGISPEDNLINVEQWATKWIETYKCDMQGATQKMYKGAIDLYIIPQLGTFKLKYLRESDIVSMLNKLNDKLRQKEIVLLTIKQILEKAVENELIYKNVARKVKLKKHKAKEKNPLSNLEIEYLKKVSKEDMRCFMLLLMLYCGLRREEVAPLIYKDIDIESKDISINKAVHWENNKPIVKKTKNEDTRKIPLLDIIFPKICELKNSHEDSELIFPMFTNKKRIMTESSIRKVIEHALKQINTVYSKDQLDTLQGVSENTEIKTIYFTYHQLRHTYACLLHKAGIDLKEAQYLTGHKDIRILLNIYTHLDEEDKQNATEKLNKFIMRPF